MRSQKNVLLTDSSNILWIDLPHFILTWLLTKHKKVNSYIVLMRVELIITSYELGIINHRTFQN